MQIVSCFSQQYLFIERFSLFNKPKGLERKHFSSDFITEHFVRSIDAGLSVWLHLVGADSHYHAWRASNHHASIEQYISRALLRGDIEAYLMPDIAALGATKQQRQCRQSDGKRVQFVPASYLVHNQSARVHAINNTTEANNAIAACQLQPHQSDALTKALNIGSNSDALTKALTSGAVVIIDDIEPRKPNAQHYVEDAAPTTSLGPHDDNQAVYVRQTPVIEPAEKLPLELEYLYKDDTPVEDISYQVIDSQGVAHEGKLCGGYARLEALPPGQCDITYLGVDEPDEKALTALRAEFNKQLAAMIAEVSQQAARENAIFEQAGLFEQWAIETGAELTGLYEGGKSLVTGVSDLAVFAIDINVKTYSACFSILKSLASGDIDSVKKDLETIVATTNKKFGALSQSFDLLIILLGDEKTRAALSDFPLDYLDAHSHVDKHRFTGIVSFEILLALLTAGTGSAVSVASKSKHLAKANSALNDIADIVKRKRLDAEQSHPLAAATPKAQKVIDKSKYELNKPTPKNSNSKDNDKLYSCDWDKCKKEHKKKLEYKNKGRVAKNSTYAKYWVEQKLEPWDVYGASDVSSASYDEYVAEFNKMNSVKEKYIQDSMKNDGKYTTQKHHLIPEGVLKDYPTLMHNIKLIGWDINSEKNGLCLPYLLNDIKRHGLQCHRGNHPKKKYNKRVQEILIQIENDSKSYCTKSLQKSLATTLNNASNKIKLKILVWAPKYILRAKSIQEKTIYGGYNR